MREFRIMVTSLCNYSCFFCHKEGNTYKSNKSNNLDANDYGFLYDVGNRVFGYKTISITGGEPLIRKDISHIVKKLHDLGAEITMTSNFYNYDMVENKQILGKTLNKLNISLHSMESGVNSKIIRKNIDLERTIKNIESFANENPNVNMGINYTLTKYNSSLENIIQAIEFAKKINGKINFSELYTNKEDEIVKYNFIEDYIVANGYIKNKGNARSLEYKKDTSIVKLTKILCVHARQSENSLEYCKNNRDLFVTPNGDIDICRESMSSINIFNEIKNRDEKLLVKKINRALDLLGLYCYV